jgi:hypothetical protein
VCCAGGTCGTYFSCDGGVCVCGVDGEACCDGEWCEMGLYCTSFLICRDR